MSLALSKTLDPIDFAELAEELTIVDQHFTSAREQHPMRRWEYAMALRALRTWKQIHPQVNVGYDVGGAGSPFSFMIRGELTVYKDFSVIDPESPYGAALDQYIGQNPRTPPMRSSASRSSNMLRISISSCIT